MKTAAIIPALNEFQQLATVVNETLNKVGLVIIVDDGSQTPLAEHLNQHSKLRVIRHAINLGKGAALKTGIEYAITQGVEGAVLLDGDGQHDPKEIPLLLRPILERRADIVFGVRSFRKGMPLIAKAGNIFLTKMLSLLFRISVSDTQSGYRALALAAYPQLKWESSQYAVETEMIVNAGKHHLRFQEVPISTIYLDRYRGTTILDGIRILLNMISWRIS